MNKLEADLLRKILISEKANSLLDVKLVYGCQSLLLYPTNDLWLTEKQYAVLKDFLKKIGENEFYYTQFDGSSTQKDGKVKVCDNSKGIFSKTNPVFKFSLNRDYSDYYDTFLFSVSVLFSINGTWAILIDETFDAGYGIFVSNADNVDRFRELYESVKTEYLEWMDERRYVEDVKFYKELLISNGVIN